MFQKRSKTVAHFLLCLIVLAISSIAASAGEVTLQLNDGNFIVEGKLVKYDGKVFVIRSEKLGQATFEASKFICISGACPDKKVNPFAFHDSVSDFSIHGSSTIGSRLMPWVIRAYAKSKKLYTRETGSKDGKKFIFTLKNRMHKTVLNIHMQKRGSRTAFPALAERKAVIGMSDRKIGEEELALLKKSGASRILAEHEHVIGLDGVVVIASPKNPISAITQDQIANIFSGKLVNWSELGGAKNKIKVYSPSRDSGALDSLKKLVLRPRKLALSSTVEFVENSTELARKVAQDPFAIGITSLAYIDRSKALQIRSACGLKSKATAFNVQTGDYPLVRRLYLYTSGTIENKHAVGLLNFAKYNDNMNSVLNIAGFINQKVRTIPFSEQKERVFASMSAPDENFEPALMRRLMQELSPAQQLSYTARFKAGSTELDDNSRLGLHRITKYLKKDLDKESYIIVAGFADSRGPFFQNTVVSLKRANTVRNMLLKRLKGHVKGSRIIARGFGELLPTSCNSTEAGRNQNRRVEIWTLKPAKGQNLKKQHIALTTMSKSSKPSSKIKSIAKKTLILEELKKTKLQRSPIKQRPIVQKKKKKPLPPMSGRGDALMQAIRANQEFEGEQPTPFGIFNIFENRKKEKPVGHMPRRGVE